MTIILLVGVVVCVVVCFVSTVYSFRKCRSVGAKNGTLQLDLNVSRLMLNDEQKRTQSVIAQLQDRFTERKTWVPPDPNIPQSAAELVRQRLLVTIPKLPVEHAETFIDLTGHLDSIIAWCEKVEEDSKPFVQPDGDSMSLPVTYKTMMDAVLVNMIQELSPRSFMVNPP